METRPLPQLDYRSQILMPLIVVSCIMALAMSWIFYVAQDLIEAGERKVQIEQTRYRIGAILSAVVDAEAGQRGYLLTGRTQFLEPYDAAVRNSGKLRADLALAGQAFPAIASQTQRITSLIEQKLRIIRDSLNLERNAGAYAPHLRLAKDRGKPVMDQIRLATASADAALVSEAGRVERKIGNRSKQLALATLLILMLIVSILYWSYKRTIWLFEHAVENIERAEKLGHIAMHDALTHLPNRRNFDEYLAKVHAQAARAHKQFALFYMDLDGFKLINDRFGHDAGDDALLATITRFTNILRESDYLARIGGDEFTLIVQDYKEQKELVILAGRIINALDKPIMSLAGQDIWMGVSIGIATYPRHAQDINDLVASADGAMYQAKISGKNQYCFAPQT
ncbi:MAG TPA: diguanylate cyclase [Methylophilaceae bacterium]|nr:diguanylate cyclase [Methylophilaceae bacterium]